jgi:hypothetical protein
VKVRLGRVWTRLLKVFDLLVLARVPILMVVAGFLLAGYVPQIRELFDISLGGDGSGWWAPSAFLFSAGLGLLVWFSARAPGGCGECSERGERGAAVHERSCAGSPIETGESGGRFTPGSWSTLAGRRVKTLTPSR